MSARVTVTSQTVASPPSGVATPSGRAFFVGQTERGPVNVPTLVRGLADYRSIFGGRTGGVSMSDAVTVAFKEGLGGAWIVRAAGPAAAAATVSLDTNKIVVTAKNPGSYANGWTAAYTSSTKTVTVVKGSAGTATYTGADLAGLQADVARDQDVTITVTALPASNVTATALASGADDYANVVVATALATLDADLGDGAVILPGRVSSAVGADLQTHCAATNRLGIVNTASGQTQAQAITAASTLGSHVVLAWPWVYAPVAGSTPALVEPAGFMAACRARAHGAAGPQQSPIKDELSRARWITGVERDTTDAEWQALHAANVSVVRTSNRVLRLYGWRTCAAPGGITNLQGAQFRDVINRVSVGCDRVGEQFVGVTVDGKGRALANFRGALLGFLASMGDAFFAGPSDPGFVVDVGPGVNTTASLAAGQLRAAVGVRLAPTAEFIFIDVTATDAAGAI